MAKHNSYHRAPSRFTPEEAPTDKHYYKNIYYGEPHDKMFEKSRFHYIEKHVCYKHKSVLDIGCNTGFFIFEALDKGAKKVKGYEGSKAAYELLSSYVDCTNDNITIKNCYFPLKENPNEKYDVVHLLNVVHHLGSDYGKTGPDDDLDGIKSDVLFQINNMAHWAEHLVFQMGFNLHGDVNKPLFSNGTKKEMIEFIKSGIMNHWEIVSIGVAQSNNGYISYFDLDPHNIARDNSLGEFLNRPIFILKSLSSI
ncbi:class I SAM-dependent methyltransferase [Vreelandella olivaria]|uniref:class I SAM-dependent methyltransferase n=1 Tax=Vreelandella olivaria TaxID=390919 RepID=UPI00201F9FE5|nr:class I SAM-dependent methyltransferase [Halomonas olivaria]